jgi:hypothetical protein
MLNGKITVKDGKDEDEGSCGLFEGTISESEWWYKRKPKSVRIANLQIKN